MSGLLPILCFFNFVGISELKIIYKVTNVINNKWHIGKDSKNYKGYLGSGLTIKAAIKKYGKENFVKEILEICENLKELSNRETGLNGQKNM